MNEPTAIQKQAIRNFQLAFPGAPIMVRVVDEAAGRFLILDIRPSMCCPEGARFYLGKVTE